MNELRINKVSELPNVGGRPLILDTETTGLDKMNDTPFLLSVTINDKSWALRFDDDVVRWLSDNMPEAEFCVFHNAKFDLHMFINAGVSNLVVDRSKIWCTMVHETLIDDMHHSYSLGGICGKRFGTKKRDDELIQWLADHCGGKPDRKTQIKNIRKAPIEMAAYYAVGDTELTKMLFDEQRKDIIRQDLEKVSNLEMDVLKALLDMERRGVPININKSKKSLTKFIKMKEEIGERIREIVGFDVNVRSGKQLEAAFKSINESVEYNKKTKNPVFDKERLSSIDNELSNLILNERSYGTMINSFLSKFPEHVYNDGKIRTDFNQTKTDKYGVITGRLSSSNPNLQQIPNPKRSGDRAAEVRAVFEAPSGSKWISNDWKQFEFRVFAHYSNDINIINEFKLNPNADYHQLVADLTGLKRDPYAKQLNLGLVFGMGQGLVAKKCGLPYTQKTKYGKVYFEAGYEAKKLFEKYHYKLSGVRKMLKAAEETAKKRGFVKTLSGRRIRFHDGGKTYKAAGLVFQGSSADLMKMKLVELNNEFRNNGSCSLILAVHDEFNFIVGNEAVKKTMKTITEIANNIPQLRVPIMSDIGISNNWLEASK